MYAGRPMETGPARDVFAAPQHPYTWGLLQSMPAIDHRLETLVAIEGSPPSLLHVPTGCPFNPRCAYAFAPCTVELPEFRRIPDGHLDRCHLPEDMKRSHWADLRALRLGAAS
jgi:peptide/nickel transport system ATP-binding protein